MLEYLTFFRSKWGMKHPTCPNCNSRKTVKYGWPRWLCQKCKKTFRRRRSDTRDRTAIDAYTKDRSTYRRLGVRWGVSHTTAIRRVQRALEQHKALLTRTKHLLPLCDGICILDGKHIRIQGKLYLLFVAWDRGLGQPIHFQLKEGGEKELWYWKMLTDLKRIGYVPKGFVSDGILTLKEYLHEAFEDLPHQRCTVHVFLAARGKVSGGRKTTERTEEFIECLRQILWSNTLTDAKRRFRKVWNNDQLTRTELLALDLIWPALPECFVCRDLRWLHLKLPRSSNAIENVMGQVEARLKTTRGMKSLAAGELLVNELLLQITKQIINH